jgi:ankyrin repeat protein
MNSSSNKKFFLLLLSFLICVFHSTSSYAELSQSELDKLLECYQEKMEKLEGSKKYEFAFSHFPKDHFYKLFIDKTRLENPKPNEKGAPPHLLFDVGEPGYHAGMTKAFQLMSTTIGKPNDLELLVSLHDQAVSNVTDGEKKGSTAAKEMEKGLSKQGWHYGVVATDIDEGFTELAVAGVLMYPKWINEQLRPNYPRACSHDRWILREMSPHYLSSYRPGEKQVGSHSYGKRERMETLLKPYLDHYSRSISKLKSLDAKLEAIAELVRTIEVFHIFPDGNQRTNAFLLLNKLLIENNIPPAILDNPIMFDGFVPRKKMSEMIKRGIVNFLNEGELSQREHLSKSCQNVTSRPEYLASHQEYTPFAETPGRPSVLEQAKLRLKQEVQARIQTKKVNELDGAEILPLSKAILFDDEASIQILLENGADPIADLGEPLTTAGLIGNQKLFLDLLKRMPSDQTDKTTWVNVVNLLTEERESSSLIPHFLKLVPKEIIDIHGYDWLQKAISKGHHETLKQLILSGVSPDSQRPEDFYPLLLMSAMRLPKEYLDLLIDHTKDVNERVNGKSALSWAIIKSRPDAAQKLLEKGAVVTQTEIDLLTKYKSDEIERLISKKQP